MVPLFFLLLSIVPPALGLISSDFNCTTGAGNSTKWAINSDSCANNYTNEACQAIYGIDGTGVLAGSVIDRPVRCYSLDGGKTFNEEVKQIAVASCPKFCGYCCTTADYNCKNQQGSKTDCSSLTSAQCTSAAQIPTLSKDCPSTCGLCRYIPPPPCVDSNAASCVSWVKNGFCTNGYYTIDQRKQYCAKSCGLC